ncbi:hypothetical protein [Halopenitus malekzadehii]|nr:hypothetical protein [Halopenitus malekzadehii]
MPDIEEEYDYDRENVVKEIEGLATARLSEPVTIEVVAWDDGDFRVEAFHTIDATYPFEAEAAGEEQGLPFYRERLAFTTTGEEEGWTRHEVVRRTCGEMGNTVVWSQRVGGYTPNWPAPIEDDEDESNDTPTYPGSTFPGRFA